MQPPRLTFSFVKKTISFDPFGKMLQFPYQTNSIPLTERKENLSEGRIF